jgi:hypothetical protein
MSLRGQSIRAALGGNSLTWLLNFMERMKANGNLHRVLLRDEKGKIVGWYIY